MVHKISEISSNSDSSPCVSSDGRSRSFQDSSFLPQSASGFQVLGFRDLGRKGFFPFGFPSAKTSKCRPTTTCPFDGRLRPIPMINRYDLFRMINGHDQILAFSNLFTLKPIRGFVYQDFVACEDKGPCPLVSQVPKRRSIATCPLHMDGPGKFHGSWDLWS
jgi:hypothetical protein